MGPSKPRGNRWEICGVYIDQVLYMDGNIVIFPRANSIHLPCYFIRAGNCLHVHIISAVLDQIIITQA